MAKIVCGGRVCDVVNRSGAQNAFKNYCLAREAWRGSFERGVWNFRYPNESQRSPMLMYAIPLNVIAESLPRNVFRMSNNDLTRSMLTNEGASGGLQPYFALAHEDDISARGGLLLHRKLLSGCK